MKIERTYNGKNSITLLEGDVVEKLKSLPDKSFDLIITSPPYNIGKEYERGKKRSYNEYLNWLEEISKILSSKIKDTGSICWQVGNYIDNGEVFPLDVPSYEMFKKQKLKLRNRIIWQFNFGLHSSKRFSGRYETLLWFTKSDNYKFNLDAVRIPQLYPGKRYSNKRGDKAGKPSGNPEGKNPSDFWEFSGGEVFLNTPIWTIPNVKANHPEKTTHPCQFPIELVERCVLAFTNTGDKVLDPFVGTGTSVIAAIKHKRKGVGIDKSPDYIRMAINRINAFSKGTLKIRPIGKAVHKPNLRDKVATVPDEWKSEKLSDGKEKKEKAKKEKKVNNGRRA